MDALFLAELNERLFVHFSQARWRAPLGRRLMPVLEFDTGRMGQIVCAEAADFERARAALGSGRAADDRVMKDALSAERDSLAALRALEGYDDVLPDSLPKVALPKSGPFALLSAADAPIALLAAVLISARDQGILWKPAPGAAASAHLLMRSLGPLSNGNFALVQGDHISGAAITDLPIVWASSQAAPMPVAVSLSAKSPRRP